MFENREMLINWILVLSGSYIYDKNLFPETFLADANNNINKIILKWTWGWTLIVVILKYIMGRPINKLNRIDWIFFIEIILSSLIFKANIIAFELIDSATGRCNLTTTSIRNLSKSSCLSHKYKWNHYFDISGHTFLLSYSSLFVNHFNNVFLVSTDDSFKKYSSLISSFISSFWKIMLFVTAIYFHTTSEKILAVLLSFISWKIFMHFKEILYKRLVRA